MRMQFDSLGLLIAIELSVKQQKKKNKKFSEYHATKNQKIKYLLNRKPRRITKSGSGFAIGLCLNRDALFKVKYVIRVPSIFDAL